MDEVHDFQDFLDALERNPQYREEIRKYILTEELLQLPVQFIVLDAKQARILELQETILENQKKLIADFIGLKEDNATLKADAAALKEAANSLKQGLTRLETRFNRLSGTMSKLDRTAYEDHASRLAPRFIARKLNIPVHRIFSRRQHTEQLDNIVNAADESLISDDEAINLQLTDLILANQPGAEITSYILAEISTTIVQHDINRARERARILEAATGTPTIPAAIGAAFAENLTPGPVQLITIPAAEELDKQYLDPTG